MNMELVHNRFANLLSLQNLFFEDYTNLKKIHIEFDNMSNLMVF